MIKTFISYPTSSKLLDLTPNWKRILIYNESQNSIDKVLPFTNFQVFSKSIRKLFPNFQSMGTSDHYYLVQDGLFLDKVCCSVACHSAKICEMRETQSLLPNIKILLNKLSKMSFKAQFTVHSDHMCFKAEWASFL